MYDRERMRELIKNPLFRSANEKLCKQFEHEEKLEETAKKVKDYLEQRPGATFAELVIEANIDIKILEELIDEGRIDVRISSSDREKIENMQKEVIRRLNSVGTSMEVKNTRDRLQQEEKIKGSGMYSKKDSLGQKPK